jgi:hypothetical protein
MMQDQEKTYGPFVPLLLLAVAVAAWLASVAQELHREAEDLRAMAAQREPLVQQSQVLWQTMSRIADQTVSLADQGNASAMAALERLEAQGINFRKKEEPVPSADADPVR